MVIDEEGYKYVRMQRALYTNPEFVVVLCNDICTVPPYDRYGAYTERLDVGLYLMGWRIEPATVDFKIENRQFITSDEMTPGILFGGAVGVDNIMWRSAAAWAKRVNAIYKKSKIYPVSINEIDKQFLEFYEEYLLP